MTLDKAAALFGGSPLLSFVRYDLPMLLDGVHECPRCKRVFGGVWSEGWCCRCVGATDEEVAFETANPVDVVPLPSGDEGDAFRSLTRMGWFVCEHYGAKPGAPRLVAMCTAHGVWVRRHTYQDLLDAVKVTAVPFASWSEFPDPRWSALLMPQQPLPHPSAASSGRGRGLWVTARPPPGTSCTRPSTGCRSSG